MTRLISPFLFLFQLHFIQAQSIEPINTDRPDQSDGTYILPKKYVQFENGLTISKNSFLNNLMCRYGISNSTELRLLVDVGKVESLKGVLPMGISVKQRLVNQNNWLPAITAVGYLRYENIASRDFVSNKVTYSLLFAFQNDFTDKFGIGYNIGATSIAKDLNFTTSFGYSPTDKLTLFAEYFSHFERQALPSHNVDFGVMYVLNDNMQIDIAYGTALSSEKFNYLTFGFSYRLNTVKQGSKNKL